MEHEIFGQNQESHRDSRGHILYFPVRCRPAAASHKRRGRLLQNRIAYACCHSGTCGHWHSDSYTHTDSYSYSHTYYDSTAYSHSADHTHTKNSSHPAASPKPVIGLHVASAGIPADEFGLSAGSRSCDAPLRDLIACPSRIPTGPLSFGQPRRRLRTVRIALYCFSFPCAKLCNAPAPTTSESGPRYPW